MGLERELWKIRWQSECGPVCLLRVDLSEQTVCRLDISKAASFVSIRYFTS